MTRTLARWWLSVLTLAVGLAALAPHVPAARGQEGFKDVFNGKDMTGFKYVLANGEKGDDPLKSSTKTWRVENGVIICSGKPNGYFYTDKSFKNYIVRFDWKYKRPANLTDDEKFGGNSGYLAHITGAHKVWPKCVEIQGQNKEHGRIFAINNGAKGSYKFDAAALKKARKPVGEWNTTEIVFQDGNITSKVNGAVVGSGKGELTEGPFGLQSEGAEIHFKNIKVRELK